VWRLVDESERSLREVEECRGRLKRRGLDEEERRQYLLRRSLGREE
jgi:hypothetical protein